MSGHWQRFRPDNNQAFTVTSVSSLELFSKVLARLKKVDISKRSWRKYQDFTELDSYIDGARGHAVGLDKQNASSLERAEAWLYALALQAPRAAVAQVTEYWAARGQEIESPKVVGLRNAEFGMRRGK